MTAHSNLTIPLAAAAKPCALAAPDTGWQIFLGVSIHETDNALRYTGSFEAGHQLTTNDIESVNLTSAIAGLATDAKAITGYSLNTTVRAGDLVMQRQLATSVEAFQLSRDIAAGEDAH